MSEGRGLHCPQCSQQVAPGVRCWSCGTVTPLSLGRKIARVGACFAPLGFCALFGGIGVLMAHVEGKANDERREAQRKLDAIDAAEQKAKEEARLATWRAANKAPEFPAGALYRPVFETRVGNTTPGLAFVVDGLGPRPVVLTAMDLLLTEGGLKEMVFLEQVRTSVKAIRLAPAFGPHDSFSLTPSQFLLPEPPSRNMTEVIALWAPPNIGWVETFRLATTAPKKRDRLWLVSPLKDGSQRLHPVTFSNARAGEFSFVFENRDLNLSGATGAPVLNGAGEVVGIHTGSHKSDLGHKPLLGSAVGVSKFLNPLRRACQAHPPGE